MAWPSCEARKTICLPSVSVAADQFVVLLDADGDNAARHHVREIFKLVFFTVPLRVAKKTYSPFFFEVLHVQDGA